MKPCLRVVSQAKLLSKSKTKFPTLKPSGLLALVLAAWLSPAWAVVDDTVRQAMEAINANQAQRAFDLLLPLEGSRSGDPDFDVALGIAANQIGQNARAIFALERVLAVQPENARARAELARALFATGDRANARKLLEETKAEGVPEGVARTIDEFLQTIDSADKASQSSLRLHVDSALGWDSNISSSPSITNVAVPRLDGALIDLQTSGSERKASFLSLGAGLNGRAELAPRWSAFGSANLSLRRFGDSTSNTDLDQIDANGGISYRNNENEFSGQLNLGQTNVGGKALRRLSGLTGEWTYRPDARRQWGTFLQWAQLDYPAQSQRNVNRTVLGTSYAGQINNKFVLFGSFYVGREKPKNADFPHLGHRLVGLRLGTQVPLNDSWSVFANATVENRRYGGDDPLFLRVRKDTQFDIAVGANWNASENWRITPQISANRNQSNIAVNDSRKSVVSVSARRAF